MKNFLGSGNKIEKKNQRSLEIITMMKRFKVWITLIFYPLFI